MRGKHPEIEVSFSQREVEIMEIAKLVPKEKKGLVVVITGYGKGKTTTALGISVRACGHDMRGYASFNS
jgi:ATP:corrinoid adenosyltransferase